MEAHSRVHQNHSQKNLRPRSPKEEIRRRCGVTWRARLHPLLRDETTNVSLAGERSRSSDSKRRALAEGKSVLISYLILCQICFSRLLKFSHCIFEFLKHHCMLESFLAPFLFLENSKIFFEH